jgi:hypothetical protein
MNLPTIFVFMCKLLAMKKLLLIGLFMTCILVFWSCKKDSSSPAQTIVTPEITDVGTPAGDIVNQTIGSGGGTIVSSDGSMELEFPANALSSNTIISIQPITNNAPGGVGKGYRFGPSGTEFSNPIKIIFHYTDEEIIGTSPHFMGIAFQDTSKAWYSLRNFTYDTINKTINSETKHFTDFATFVDLILSPSEEKVKINESKVFKVLVLDDPSNGDELTALTPATGDEVAPLAKQHEVNDGLVKNWAANGIVGGNSQYGIITPQGAHCSFKAPATKPAGSKNPVQLSVEINMRYKDPLTKKDYGKLQLNSYVEINDNNYAFHLEVEYTDPNWYEAYATWTVTDLASMDVEVKDDSTIITNYENQNGKVTPASQNVSLGGDNCVATWLPADFAGPLTINEVTGYAYSASGIPGGTKTLLFQIITSQRITPKFSEVCNIGGSFTFGGVDQGVDYYGAEFLLKYSDQVFNDPVTTQLVYKLTAK